MKVLNSKIKIQIKHKVQITKLKASTMSFRPNPSHISKKYVKGNGEISLREMSTKSYYTYIMMNKWNTVSYTGMTSDLSERSWQHKEKIVKGFTQKYNINKLVYYETFDSPTDAIEREKQIKKWSRKKKLELIKTVNPELKDLSDELGA